MALLNADQIAFAKELAAATGLHPVTIGAWALCEEPASRDPVAQGHNWLNLLSEDAWKANGSRTYSGVPIAPWTARFARFNTRADAVKEAAVWINDFSNYAGIRATKGKDPLSQVNAIAASPWDAGHYGDGKSIRATLTEVEKAGILGTAPPVRHHWWTITADGGKHIARTQHPKRWIGTHFLFSHHHDIRFHRED